MSQYSLLEHFPAGPQRDAVKLLMDRLAALEAQAGGIGGVTKALTTHLDAGKNQLKSVADPTAKTDAVNLQFLQRYVQGALALDKTVAAVPPIVVPGTPSSAPLPAPSPGSGLTCYTSLAMAQPAGVPAAPNLRWWRGDFCGVNVPGLPAVAGGAADPTLVFSPFLDRYGPADQAAILSTYKARGYTHYVLSWGDSRVGNGQSIAQFVATAQMVQANGLYPCVFFCDKDHDTPDVPTIMASVTPLIAALQAGGCLPIACVGWELSLWLTPTQVQQLIDQIAALVVPGTNLYVHFQEDYIAFQQPGGVTADFWNLQVGKLTGLLHHKNMLQDCGLYQARIADGLERFKGGIGFAADSGFGHPFDYVTYEVSARGRFSGGLTEAQGRALGNQGICAPAVPITSGPYAGTSIVVMGYGNGADLA